MKLNHTLAALAAHGCFGVLLAAPILPAMAAPAADAATVPGEAQGARRAFDIAAQPLSAALVQFSRQGGVQILTASKDIEQFRNQAVSGRWTVREALERMLDNTGLVYHFQSDNTVVVSRGEPMHAVSTTVPQARPAPAAAPIVVAQATPRAAQPVAADAAAEETIIVTGSHVPTTKDAVAVSVIEVDREKLEKTGVSSDVLEVLRKGIPSFQGRSNTGASNANNTNQNTAGGSQIQLRNLDTLILVNGRRMAISAIAGVGGKAFVNAGSIPPAAIERIEVISDGSSAIYGSDAIGGVVNLILKSDFNGSEVGGRFAAAKGNYTERSAYFTSGFAKDNWNVTVSGTLSHTDPLYQNKRGFSSPFYGTSASIPASIAAGAAGVSAPNTGAVLAPGLTSPGVAQAPNGAGLVANGIYVPAAVANTYDLSQFQTLLLKQDMTAVTLNGNWDLLPSRQLTAFGDVIYSDNKSFTQFLPVVTAVTVGAGAPNNPTTAAFTGNFGDVDLPKQFHNDQQAVRVAGGLRGEFGDGWGWEASYTHSQNRLEQLQKNVIDRNQLNAAVASGLLNPFARGAGLSAAGLAAVYGTEAINAKSTLDSVDASLNGTVLELPAGKPGFAVGLGHRRESLSAHADANGRNTGAGSQNWIGGQFYDPFTKARTVDSAFGELRFPITSEKWNVPGLHALDLIAAARHERYSDAGNSDVPKLGFRWQPIDRDLTVRGSYSKSFTAPTLYAEGGPTATRIVGTGVVTTAFGNIGGNNNGLSGQDGNNPDLQPSKATTKSINIAWKPSQLPGLSTSLEYSAVDQKGFPGGIGFTNILQSINAQGSASPFYNNLGLNGFVGQGGTQPFATPGSLLAYVNTPGNSTQSLFVVDRFMNLGGVKVRSYTATAEYAMDFKDAGLWTLGTIGTIFKSYQFQALPYQKFYEYAGTATNGGTGVQGTLPKYRFYTTLDWQKGPWTTTVGNTYVSSVTDQGAGGIVYETSTTLKPVHVSSYSSWDFRVTYTGAPDPSMVAKGWSVTLGVNNAFDKMPPFSRQAFTDNNVDVATYSPIGRLIYASAQMKF